MTAADTFAAASARAALAADRLDQLADAVSSIGVGLDQSAARLREKAAQLRADRFRILVVGEFKRGKSTLLNALLGAAVLPQKVTPCTAVVTVIRYAESPSVEVAFNDGRAAATLSLEDFQREYELAVSDTTATAAAAERFQHVDRATVGFPVALCRNGVELVDSPGLGEHGVRSARTRRFLPQADAVVMVLDATQLFSQEEEHFLETDVLPLGLTNVFFAVNKWNLIDESVVRPEDAEAQKTELNVRLSQKVAPFCRLNGRGSAIERVFRVNALGALKARLRNPVSAAMLDESGVPALEDALRQFLLTERTAVRAEVVAGLVRGTTADAERYIAAQLDAAARSTAEVEAERAAIQPRLERLRGIRRHTAGYLQSQSQVLQDRLTVSLLQHLRRMEAELPAEVEKFDLTPITKRFMLWQGIKNFWNAENERRFQKEIEACLLPQVTRLLEKKLGDWQRAVVGNELRAVGLEVEKHLKDEAAEYRRVLSEIEARVGGLVAPQDEKGLIERWTDGELIGAGGVSLPVGGALAEAVGGLIALIMVEVVAEAVLHIATGGLLLIVSAAFAVFRMGWREQRLRTDLQNSIVKGLREALAGISDKQSAAIRSHVKEGFDLLESRFCGGMAAQIEQIDASLRDVLERKKSAEFSAAAEKSRLTSARSAVGSLAAQVNAALRG